MATKSKFQAIKGTRDLLPPETALWNRVEQTAHEVFATFGFGEIRLPIFEPTELFARAVGGETDIVSKEMYVFPENPNWADLEQRRFFCGEMYANYKETGLPDMFLMSVVNLLETIESMTAQREINLGPELASDRDQMKNLLEEFRINGDAKILGLVNLKIQTFRFVESVSLRPEATA